MTKTISILIGNSDNKLSQKDWSEYAEEVTDLIFKHAYQIHFSGASHSLDVWQNACWVFLIVDTLEETMKADLKKIREKYNQKSAVWLEGNPIEFI